MSLQKICDIINSLQYSVDSLQHCDTRVFARRYDGPDAIDEPLDESLDCFISTIKSLRCILTDKVEIHMMRYFTKKEVLSGKVSKNMQSFLWNLGYIVNGAGLFDEAFIPEKRNNVEAILYVDVAFTKTLPPVRSLQSLTFDAVQNSHESLLFQEYLNDNPTISPTECLQMKKESVTYCDLKDFFGEKSSPSSILYVGGTKDSVISYYYTTCLMCIETNVKIKYNSLSHQYENALLFDSKQLLTADLLINGILQDCVKDIADVSQIVKDSMHHCHNFWGLVFDSPLDSYHNRAVLGQLIFFLSASDSKYIKKCFVSHSSSSPPKVCRHHVEMEAAFQASITFLLGAVTRYWENNFH